MKDNKKLYESIMASVAKEVKKAINEGEEYEEVDIQQDTEDWIEAIRHYLDANTDSDMTLKWYVTLMPAYNGIDEYEASHYADLLMYAIEQDGNYQVAPMDEVFNAPIASEIMHGSLIQEFIEKVNQLHTLDINDFD